MKKIKILGIAATALIAVAPIVTSITPVSADTTTVSTSNDVSENPVITFAGKAYTQNQSINDVTDNASFNYVPVRKFNSMSETQQAIEKAFTATASTKDKTPVSVKINMDNFNWEVAGRYPTTVTATNAAGKTTTLSFNVYVGEKNAGAVYKVAKNPDGGNLYVFYVKDGKISKAPVTIKSNTDLATFGTVTVNNVSFTRLNSPDSDIFIQTSDFDNNDKKPITQTSTPVEKTLMHSALLYTSEGKSMGEKYDSYRKVTVYPDKVNINGENYYQVFSTSMYVKSYIKASNIDGTKRSLKHNAYIYATSTRRADRTVLKKGTQITTYGGSYKFKNGKRYYRIQGATANNKRYVKVANFN